MSGAAASHAFLESVQAVPVSLPEGVPNVEAARARLRHGIPALAGEPLLTGGEMRRNVFAILRGLSGAGGELGDMARGVTTEFTRSDARLEWDVVAEIALTARWDAMHDLLARVQADPYAITTLLDWAARPALRTAAAEVAAVVAESDWQHGTCPSCGSLPALAELSSSGASGRTLRCARCAAAWSFARLACPACGERDHQRLGALHGENESEFRRVDWCATCRFYVKALATLHPLSGQEIFEQDLASASLDVIAVQRGYWRGTVRPNVDPG